MNAHARKGGGGVPRKRRTEVEVLKRRLRKANRRINNNVNVIQEQATMDRLSQRLEFIL